MKNKNRRKKIKLIASIAICCLLFNLKKTKALEFNAEKLPSYENYTYTTAHQTYDFDLFGDKKTNLPLFRERGNTPIIDFDGYKPWGNLPYEPYIFNAFYLTTEGKGLTAENKDKRIAMQIYLYEKFATSNEDDLSFNFDITKYHKIAAELFSEGKKMIQDKTYEFEVKKDEWTKITFPFPEEFTLENNANFLIKEENNEVFLKALNEGDYDLNVDTNAFKEEYTYFSSLHPEKSGYVTVTKPRLANKVTAKIHVLPPIYNIHTPLNQVGYNLEIADKSLKEKTVNYKLTLEDNFELKKFEIKDNEGKQIKEENNSFIMPSEDVFINVEVASNVHNINIEEVEGVTIEAPKTAIANKVVKLKVTCAQGYVLKGLKINDRYVNLNTLSFIMPNEEITLKAQVEKQKYKIIWSGAKASMTINDYAVVGEKVSFDIFYEEGYQLDELKIVTISKKEIEVTNNTFIMPSEEVLIDIKTKKIPYHIIKDIDENFTITNLQDTSEWGKTVKVKYELNSNYELATFTVKTVSGEEITITDNTFKMPKEDVIITLKAKQLISEDENNYHYVFFYTEDGDEIGPPLVLKNNTVFSIPYFHDYDIVECITKGYEHIYETARGYMTNENLVFIFRNKDEASESEYLDPLEIDDRELAKYNEYHYKEIPSTFDNGLNPIFLILGVSLMFYVKKYLLA